ncbi:hypothetical protein [Streptomyces sp. NPDC005131]
MADIETPRLITPEGALMSQPESPQQYHDHPYVWAWNVILGATSRDFIARECLAAERDGAPPDAVYKTRDDDPSMPGEWITVGMVINADQQRRVREYAHTLVDHHEALHELGKQRKAQPPQGADEPEQSEVAEEPKEPEAAEEPEQYEYKVSFVARISGKATAASYEEAMQQLAPPEQTADSGYVGGLATDLAGVVWFLNFDSRAGSSSPRTTRACRNCRRRRPRPSNRRSPRRPGSAPRLPVGWSSGASIPPSRRSEQARPRTQPQRQRRSRVARHWGASSGSTPWPAGSSAAFFASPSRPCTGVGWSGLQPKDIRLPQRTASSNAPPGEP